MTNEFKNEIRVVGEHPTTHYSAFSCTCTDESTERYEKEFLRIWNEECLNQYNTFDEIMSNNPLSWFDTLIHILDNEYYYITCIATDMWSAMSLQNHKHRDNAPLPTIRVEYDLFAFGFVDAYRIIKHIQKQDTTKEI